MAVKQPTKFVVIDTKENTYYVYHGKKRKYTLQFTSPIDASVVEWIRTDTEAAVEAFSRGKEAE